MKANISSQIVMKFRYLGTILTN